MRRGALYITFGSAVNAIVGIAFQLVLARWLGVSAPVDAYALATMVPTLAATVMVSALPAVLVPEFVRFRGKNSEAQIPITTLAPMFLAVVLAFAVFCAIGLTIASVSPPSSIAGTQSLFRTYILLSAITIPLAWFSSCCQANLVSASRFLAVGLAGAVNGIGLLATSACAIVFDLGPAYLAVGYLVGYLLQTVALYAASRPLWGGAILDRRSDIAITYSALTMTMAALIYKSQPIVERTLSAQFEGGPAIIAYSEKVSQGILLASTIGLAMVSLPAVSEMVARLDYAGAFETSAKLSTAIGLISAPLVGTAIFNSRKIVEILYQGGNFTENDTQMSAKILSISLVGVAFSAFSGPIVNLLYAHRKYKLVTTIAITTLVIGVLLSLLMRKIIGLEGVVWGGTIMLIANFFLFLVTVIKLSQRNILPYLRDLALIFASCLTVTYAISSILSRFEPSTPPVVTSVIKCAVVLAIGAATSLAIWAVMRKRENEDRILDAR